MIFFPFNKTNTFNFCGENKNNELSTTVYCSICRMNVKIGHIKVHKAKKKKKKKNIYICVCFRFQAEKKLGMVGRNNILFCQNILFSR